VRRGDHRLSHCRNTVRQRAASSRVELGEHVVEQQQRRAGQKLCFGEQQREDGETLFPLRAILAEVARPARDQYIVEVRAGTGRATVDVTVEPCLERRGRGFLCRVPEPRVVEPELRSTLREPLRERGERRGERGLLLHLLGRRPCD